MNLKEWLTAYGLTDLEALLREQGVETPEDLVGLTDTELKEDCGIKVVPRKKLLKAIEVLAAEEISPLQNLVGLLPAPVALPLREYVEETHPVARLWAACDAVEMVLRLVVIAEVAGQSPAGELSDPLKKQMADLIEMPTLGGWFVMAQHLAADAASPVREGITGPLRDLLYGPDKPGTPESSFLRLRNRLAHGGGLMREEANRLLKLWQPRFEDSIAALEFLQGWELMSPDASGEWLRLQGTEVGTLNEAPVASEVFPGELWLRNGVVCLRLWPLALFGVPSVGGNEGSQPVPQLYCRRGPLRLTYTPIGSSGLGESESDPQAVAGFERLFSRPKTEADMQFKVAGYEHEIRRDAARMVGRELETQQVLDALGQRESGVWWLSGVAGMGKSYLMARLACRLGDEAEEEETVLAYRFRESDQTRCQRQAFADFLIERLQAGELLREFYQDNPDDKAEKRLENLFNALRRDRRLLLLLDGLDEIARTDAAFAEEIPLALRYPRIRWVCAGRPEADLPGQMKRFTAIPLFPEGLPPMQSEDIRAMLMEKVGPLRKKLLKQDREEGATLVNPFIEKVCEHAAGLPLYVNYVLGDVLSGRYRVLDGDEALPQSLHAYHEELLRRLGIGDLQAVVTPLVATIACAYEPLSTQEIIAALRFRKLLGKDGGPLVERALAAVASMLRTATDPEGGLGYTLFHQSLQDHILQSPQMTHSVSTAREALADLSELESPPECLEKYLLRCGVEHLLQEGREDKAEARVLNLHHFQGMCRAVDSQRLFVWVDNMMGHLDGMPLWESSEKVLQSGVTDKVIDAIQCVFEFALYAGFYPLAKKLYEGVLEEWNGSQKWDPLRSFHITGKYCDLCRTTGAYEKSLDLAKKNYDFALDHFPDNFERLDSARHGLACSYFGMGDRSNAEKLFREVLAQRTKHFGVTHPDTCLTMMNLSHCVEPGEEKLQILESGSNGYLNYFGAGNVHYRKSQSELGLAYLRCGEIDKAKIYIEEAYNWLAGEGVGWQDHIPTFSIAINRAELAEHEEELRMANVILSELLGKIDERRSYNLSVLPRILNNHLRLLRKSKHWRAYLPELLWAIDDVAAEYENDNEDLVVWLDNLLSFGKRSAWPEKYEGDNVLTEKGALRIIHHLEKTDRFSPDQKANFIRNLTIYVDKVEGQEIHFEFASKWFQFELAAGVPNGSPSLRRFLAKLLFERQKSCSDQATVEELNRIESWWDGGIDLLEQGEIRKVLRYIKDGYE
jgi:tetratricopeptide (TPR) repeat protein